jgi:hypothetical protein
MKKARKPAPAKKAGQKKPMAKPSKKKKAEGAAELAEAAVRLTKSADKLAQAAEKLSQAAARLESVAEPDVQPRREASGPADELPEDKPTEDNGHNETD